jgi:hypothetical protein
VAHRSVSGVAERGLGSFSWVELKAVGHSQGSPWKVLQYPLLSMFENCRVLQRGERHPYIPCRNGVRGLGIQGTFVCPQILLKHDSRLISEAVLLWSTAYLALACFLCSGVRGQFVCLEKPSEMVSDMCVHMLLKTVARSLLWRAICSGRSRTTTFIISSYKGRLGEIVPFDFQSVSQWLAPGK